MVFNWSVNQSNQMYNVAHVNQKHFGDDRMKEHRQADKQKDRQTHIQADRLSFSSLYFRKPG